MSLFSTKLNKPSKKKRDNLQNPKILEVNLVRDEVQVSFDWKKNILILSLTLLIAAAVMTEIYLGLNWWADQEEQASQIWARETDKLNAETVSLKNQAAPALAYKAKSAVFGRLLDSHIYYSQFLSYLEKNTLSTVKYSGFHGDLSGHYSLGGTAANFAEAAWQVRSFLNDPLTVKAEIASVQASAAKDKQTAGGVSFTLLLQVKPEIFKK